LYGAESVNAKGHIKTDNILLKDDGIFVANPHDTKGGRGMKVVKVKEGRWYRLQPEDRMTCCDCGLVHRVNFKALMYPKRKLRLFIKYFRDEDETYRIRKKYHKPK